MIGDQQVVPGGNNQNWKRPSICFKLNMYVWMRSMITYSVSLPDVLIRESRVPENFDPAILDREELFDLHQKHLFEGLFPSCG